MAKRKKSTRHHKPVEEQPKGDFAALADHAAENPWLYIGSVVVILLCVAVGVMFRLHMRSVDKDVATAYARALDHDEPADVIEALKPLAEESSDVAVEVLYVLGEKSYGAEDYEGARAAFERLRTEHSDSPLVSNAVEGLGFIAIDENDYAQAIGYFQEIQKNWPDSFAAQRQPYNIARSHEWAGQLEEAVAAYSEQTLVFPDSNVARNAQTALDRLRQAHPELQEEMTPIDDLFGDTGLLQGAGTTAEATSGEEDAPDETQELLLELPTGDSATDSAQ